jgi:hypothetical protein
MDILPRICSPEDIPASRKRLKGSGPKPGKARTRFARQVLEQAQAQPDRAQVVDCTSEYQAELYRAAFHYVARVVGSPVRVQREDTRIKVWLRDGQQLRLL